jgi:hypothetical protein
MKKQIFTFETISAVIFGAVIIGGFIAVIAKVLF